MAANALRLGVVVGVEHVSVRDRGPHVLTRAECKMIGAFRRQVPHIAWQQGVPFVAMCGRPQLDLPALKWVEAWHGRHP